MNSYKVRRNLILTAIVGIIYTELGFLGVTRAALNDKTFDSQKFEEEMQRGFETDIPVVNFFYKIVVELPTRPGRNLAYLLDGK